MKEQAETAFQCGLDRLSGDDRLLRGKRIALLTNDAAVNKNLQSSVDVLQKQFGLKALFAPEHGVRSEHQAGEPIPVSVDRQTGLPVRSLYGDHQSPTQEELSDVDLFVVDLQDVGARYYTYLYTLSSVMEACADCGKPVVVLDRPNPLGGLHVEGTCLNPLYCSLVGRYPIPARYGLTIGEFARYINDTQNMHCELTIIPMSGWQRRNYFDDQNRPWIAPSPNIPTLETALLYIGTCLFEGTNVSEGRGTTRPFKLIGAPWLDTDRVLETIDQDAIKGCILRPCFFYPLYSKYVQTTCRGFEIHVADRDCFHSFAAGVALLDAIRKTHHDFSFIAPQNPQQHWFIDHLSGGSELRDPDFNLRVFLEKACSDEAAFKNKSQAYYIYTE